MEREGGIEIAGSKRRVEGHGEGGGGEKIEIADFKTQGGTDWERVLEEGGLKSQNEHAWEEGMGRWAGGGGEV